MDDLLLLLFSWFSEVGFEICGGPPSMNWKPLGLPEAVLEDGFGATCDLDIVLRV